MKAVDSFFENRTKEEILEIFNSATSLIAIAELIGVAPITQNNRLIRRWAAFVGFNPDSYRPKKQAKYCLQCGKELVKWQEKFCSSSCAATYNNLAGKTGRASKQNKEPLPRCPICGKPVSSRKRKFCSQLCSARYQHMIKVNDWIEQGNCKSRNDGRTLQWLRKHLIEAHNGQCEICGFNGINPHTGLSVLEMHHIDGDCTNNKPENLQILCPNCHSMTPNYRSRNKGCSRGKIQRPKD